MLSRRAVVELPVAMRAVCATFCTTSSLREQKSYKMVVVGGGTGGMATANKFAKRVGKGNLALIEPNDTHYYQPMFTLVGAGIKEFRQTHQPTATFIPPDADWLQDRLASVDPDNSVITTEKGTEIKYDYLVIAMGMQLNYNLVKGLTEALEADPTVVSNYSPKYVTKTYPAIGNFKDGNAIFTFPNTPIKCAGAPQKIMHLTDQFFRKHGKRDNARVIFNSALGVIFGVKKYAEVLTQLANERNIEVNFKTNLTEVRHNKKEAVFQNLDSGESHTVQYSLLHAVPPMSAPDALRKHDNLVDAAGYLDVNKNTLQHNRYPNIFGVGDCTSIPTSKTAAAVAAQVGILRHNLGNYMKGQDLKKSYDGYTSCPLVTSYGKCILAEFDFDAQPLETFPINQGKERRSMYQMKTQIMPQLYWHMLLTGNWEGPRVFRKAFRLGMGK